MTSAVACVLKSRRDDLFIVMKRHELLSFCFSAARANAAHYVGRSEPLWDLQKCL